ncbi:MAG: protein kinase [Bryobacteraceae bacterium]|nr:protein kinase [Bryobacteraceae bacterium]
MQRLGRYEILDELGRGAMGVVYRARDPSIGRLLAIKTIRMAELSDPAEAERLRERMRREAHSAGILSHPGIVVVYDVGQEGELAYIAMELVPGRSLESIMEDKDPPNRQTILSILRQTAAALDYAHRKGIVHRDIKPANILINEDGVAKITDFGVAKISSSHQLTIAGTVLGTPNYMSPEQVQGKPVDGRADQFSLAVIAYELLTGQKPFAGDTLTTVLYKIVAEQPRPPQEINPSLPWPVSLVLGRALSKNPDERYPSCTEFVDALERALSTKPDWQAGKPTGEEALPTATVGTTVKEQVAARVEEAAVAPARPARRSRPRAAMLVVALLGLAVVAGGVFVGWQRARSSSPAPEQPMMTEGTGAPARPSPMPLPLERASSGTGAPSATSENTPAGTVAQAPVTTPVQAPVGAQGSSAASEAPPASGGHSKAGPEAQPARVQTAPAQSLPPVTPASPPRKGGAPGEHKLLVTSSPPGAEVVFDANPELKCKTPCSIALSPGRHTLVATLAGHRPEMRILEVSGPREVFLSMTAQTGTVRVETTPSGAQILLNGQMRPETTPATLVLPIGKYQVEVVKDGARDQQVVEIKEGALVRLSFQLSQ